MTDEWNIWESFFNEGFKQHCENDCNPNFILLKNGDALLAR